MALYFLVLLILVFFSVWLIIAQPSWSKNKPISVPISHEKLKEHVRFLSVEAFPRHEMTILQMEKAARYIEESFGNNGCIVERQEVISRGRSYYNIIGKLNVGLGHKMVIGAHYDSCFDTPGADDNASGVAGLIELSALLAKANLPFEIELVAYTLEENGLIGSAVHAKALSQKNEKIDGVIVFEMIGYFSDESNSQKYPLPLLNMFYPSQGNFIAVVGIINQRHFTKNVKSGMQGSTDLPVYSINAPISLRDIARSDHASYWQYGYDAVMITDTANFRNEAYHTNKDTLDRLDFERMGKVVLSVYNYLATRKLGDK